jgi:hypothetical protein
MRWIGQLLWLLGLGKWSKVAELPLANPAEPVESEAAPAIDLATGWLTREGYQRELAHQHGRSQAGFRETRG